MRSRPVALLAALPLVAAACWQVSAAETNGRLRLVTTETCLAKLHTGNIAGHPRFVASPDNRHEAHPIAPFGKPMVVALDGQAYGPGCQGIYDSTLTFSPDSRRLAFVAGAPQKGAQRSVVLDGVEGKQYDDVAMPLTFSPDSKRFAYLARKGKVWLAVVDGVEMKEYEQAAGPIAFDGEGKRFAYSAKAKGKWCIVADGQEGDGYDLAVSPVLSSDGTHLAFAVKSGARCFAVVDGESQKEYEDLATFSLTFSPDGKHLCYIAKRGESWFVVADGVEGTGYDAASYPKYSPDSTRLAYYGVRGGKVMVVADGVEGKQYDQAAWLTFSPDSRRLAYVAILGEKKSVVVDGAAGPEYETVMAPTFSPDSRRLAYLAGTKDKLAVVVDGAETKCYDGIFWNTRPVFDGPDRLHVLVRLGPDLDAYCVDVQATEE